MSSAARAAIALTSGKTWIWRLDCGAGVGIEFPFAVLQGLKPPYARG
jgi:hypothetical protein